MSGSDPYVPGHGDASYAVESYDLDLAYRVDGNRLDGTATLTCRALEDLDRIRIDLRGLRPAKVGVDGRGVRHSHRLGVLRVTLNDPVTAGSTFEVRVKYAGNPAPIRAKHLGEAGWEELLDGVIVASQPHGAPSWFPCNDRPDDKAGYRLRIAVPSGYHVAFSGELVSTRTRGSVREWEFRQSAPMATYLATVQIGQYAVHEQSASVPMRTIAPADIAGSGFEAAFGDQPSMMAFFVDRFGPYPFASYTTVITDDDLEIPLESQALSTFGRNFARDDWDAIRLVAHELAHQWFGNAVTLREWKDIWLHEGFACYAEWLWSEESGRRSAADWADHHYQRLSSLPQDLLLGDPGPELMFDDRVYKRGALTLHALRTAVGDEAFFDVLRSWVSTHTGGSVGTVDLVALASASTGHDLGGLFDAWVYSTELPPR